MTDLQDSSTPLILEGPQAAARRARYEQVQRSRQLTSGIEASDGLSEFCHLYDLVRVSEEDRERQQKETLRERAKREAAEREGQLLCNFLPLLREHVPQTAREVEAKLHDASQSQRVSPEGAEEDHMEYVYDVYYAPEDSPQADQVAAFHDCPVVEVCEDADYDWREGPPADFDSEDSNDENNPHNDYPDDEDFTSDDGERDRARRGFYGSDEEEYSRVAYDPEIDDEQSE